MAEFKNYSLIFGTHRQYKVFKKMPLRKIRLTGVLTAAIVIILIGIHCQRLHKQLITTSLVTKNFMWIVGLHVGAKITLFFTSESPGRS
jgi:hypothetical protein